MPAAPSEPQAGVLVAAVGLPWMRDHAFGLKVLERLRTAALPPAVELADCSAATIAAVQRLAERGYRRAIVVSGTPCARPPGTLHRLTPPPDPPPPEEIHARIGDCVMGAVSVDNFVVIGRFCGRLPGDVVLIEAEPVDDGWGGELSPALASLVDRAVAAVLEEIRGGRGDRAWSI